ncbi:MAG: hypothetical protein GF387_01985 [Candidatus Portnoybacteria bacterium]|nr:hypothetical protein [Candidatus Portnoybacteria bacterium]
MKIFSNFFKGIGSVLMVFPRSWYERRVDLCDREWSIGDGFAEDVENLRKDWADVDWDKALDEEGR